MKLILVLFLLASEAWPRCATGTIGLWSWEQNANDICGTYNALSTNGTASYSVSLPVPKDRFYSLSPSGAVDFTMPEALVTFMNARVPWSVQVWSYRSASRATNNYVYGSSLLAAYGPFLQLGDATTDNIRFDTRAGSVTPLVYTVDPTDWREVWHHIAAVGAASNSRQIYADGALVASDTGNGTHDTMDTIYIGRFGTVDTNMSSWIDQFRLMSTAGTAFPTVDPAGSGSTFISNGSRLYPTLQTIR